MSESTNEAPACIWRGAGQPRAIKNRHVDTCNGFTESGEDCRGCVDCPEDHCLGDACRGRNHSATICGECMTAARNDLSAIASMSGYAMLEEAMSKGIDSEAVAMLGPAAIPREWQRIAVSAMLGQVDDAYLADCRDEEHPLWVLTWIENEWRDYLGQPTTLTARIDRAADYLGSVMHIIASRAGDEQAPEFSDAARRLRQCRAHLEDVLSEGVREEKGAPCPACRAKGMESPPALVKVRVSKDTTGASDRWVCGRCKSRWSEADYRLRVGKDHIEHATELTTTDMVTRTRVPAGTIRRWASKHTVMVGDEPVEIPPALKSCGRSEDGRKLYRVSDVLSLRDGKDLRVA